MEALLLSYLNDLIKKNQIPKDWKNRFIEILDEYMGAPPVKFTYEGKEYTPITFANSLKIKETNYALFSSFEYKSYYKKHIVEVPDNWLMKKAYNLPLDEMMKIIDNALNMGFPVAITCDITERGYVWKDGIALVVTKENIDDFLYNDVFGKNAKPINEPDITSTMRQEAFDNYQTTDDHSILIVGTAKDKYGKKYYYAKNSWGTENTAYKGYIYMSESYIRYKTLTILVNKITVPKDILNKYESECN